MLVRHTLVAVGLGVALAVGGMVGAGGAAQPAAASDPLALDGHTWTRYSSEAREAFLAGFIAGAAAQQVTSAHRGIHGARAAAEAVKLKREGAFTFPYATNVYRSHLDDWYFYHNRRDQTLLEVLVEMNEVSRGPGR